MDAKLKAKIRAKLFRCAGYQPVPLVFVETPGPRQRVTEAKSWHKAVELVSNGPLFVSTPDWLDSHKVYYGIFLYLIRSYIYVNLLPNQFGLVGFSCRPSTAATSDP
jgi:hypothetical protein